MKKQLREKVYAKYCGHCAYCGKDIEYKNMQVDHINPHFGYKELRDDSFENLNPSCRRCNHYKRAYTLEDFRNLMMTLHERVVKQYITKVAIDYGIVKIEPFEGQFYFEKL